MPDYRLIPAAVDPQTRLALRLADLESRLSRIEGQAAAPVTAYSTGPVAGSGGSITTPTAFTDSVSSRQLIFTSLTTATRGHVMWKSRWDCQTAAWAWGVAGVAISPAPVADYDGRWIGGNPNGRDIQVGHNAGVTYNTFKGEFLVDLAAGTTYTISHYMNSGNGTWVWDSSMALSNISIELYPR